MKPINYLASEIEKYHWNSSDIADLKWATRIIIVVGLTLMIMNLNTYPWTIAQWCGVVVGSLSVAGILVAETVPSLIRYQIILCATILLLQLQR